MARLLSVREAFFLLGAPKSLCVNHFKKNVREGEISNLVKTSGLPEVTLAQMKLLRLKQAQAVPKQPASHLVGACGTPS